MLSGDPAAVAKWSEAISNYAEFASKWKSKGGILNLLTERAGRDGEVVFKVAPSQAADVVFTATASGLASKTGLPRDLITLQRNLPKDQWDAMRQEAFIRLMDTARGGMRGGETQVSGVNFKKQWENLREKNPGVVNGLFTKEEQNLIQQFADVSARATNTLANTSNTAAAASGLIQTIAASLGGKGPVQFAMRLPIANALRNAYGGTLAAMAASGRVPAGATPLTTGAAGAGAAAANTEEGRRQINAIPPVVGGVYNRMMGLLGE
jgi:hypothetical protein